jgi:acyl-CoA dehydrogenase
MAIVADEGLAAHLLEPSMTSVVLNLSVSGLEPWLLVPAALLAAVALGFFGAPLWLWTLATLGGLAVAGASWPWLVLAGAILLPLNLPDLRRRLLSGPALRLTRRLGLLPSISDTERQAIDAGTVWIDAELFSGRPDWKRVLAVGYPDLTDDEKRFLDGPVEELCRIVNDWQTWQHGDLAPEVWEFAKREKLFGMIIPKEYGGLGMRASVNSAVVQKLASRSLPLAVTVMVPNSLGPAELLVHYGTEEQKRRWLPRLATGEEVPCFALTEPGAGSDAGSIRAEGVVFQGEDGKPWLRLNWDKRYITLAAVATVLGLAFRLRDPKNLLGKGTDPGITCALIPTSTAGVVLGRRHDPLGVPFFNCPTQGHDVVVPIDAILGGADGAGRGWRMLMECLAAGRGISIPACAAGGAKLVTRVASAHALVRKQFGLSIGRFEGIEEPLARITGLGYVLEAARRFTCAGLDGGAKPSVVTAIAKYQFSELFRRIINDGMDVLGGNGISLGPRNLLGHAYIGAPISITVEGANILTRTLVVFGQGSIRCHPYLLAEVRAIETGDVAAFDAALCGHVRHVVRNACRSLVLDLTRGRFARSPVWGPSKRYFQRLGWASARFALLADVALLTLAGDLKRREKLAGRFADAFAWLYLGAATLRRFEAQGRRKEDLAVMRWGVEHALAEIDRALAGILQNFGGSLLGWLLRAPLGLWARINRLGAGPSDRLGGQVARAVQQDGSLREVLTRGMYLPKDADQPLAQLEQAFATCAKAEEVLAKVKDAVRSGRIARGKPEQMLEQAVASNVVSADDARLVRAAEEARAAVIAVDSFSLEEYALGSDPNAYVSGTLP